MYSYNISTLNEGQCLLSLDMSNIYLTLQSSKNDYMKIHALFLLLIVKVLYYYSNYHFLKLNFYISFHNDLTSKNVKLKIPNLFSLKKMDRAFIYTAYSFANSELAKHIGFFLLQSLILI